MNFYVERDSLNTDLENYEPKSDNKNMKNECHKTVSNLLIQKNVNLESDPINVKAVNIKNSTPPFKFAKTASSFTSYIKDSNGDEKKFMHDQSTRKLKNDCNIFNKSKILIRNYDKPLINFVKPINVIEASIQAEVKNQNLISNCIGSSNVTPKTVEQFKNNADTKVDLTNQTLEKKKRTKTEIPNSIQMTCNTCKCTRRCKSRDKKCYQCDTSMKYQCKQCNICYDTYRKAYQHVRIMCTYNISLFKCAECDYTSNKKYNLQIHTKQMHSETECVECSTKFENNVLLKRHQVLECENLKFYSIVEYYCSTCKKAIPKGRKLDCSSCNQTPYIRCIKCFTVCENDKWAYRHIKRCYNKIELHCNDCNYTTYTKGSLRIHIKSKHPRKLFICKMCGEKYSTLAALKLHRVINHKTKKEYPLQLYCQKCEVSFRGISMEKLNCSECFTELIYKCMDCFEIFSHYLDGKKHVKDNCNGRELVKENKRTKHKDLSSIYKCTLCNYVSTLGGVKIHVAKKHPDNNESFIQITNNNISITKSCIMQSGICNISENHYNTHTEKEHVFNDQSNDIQNRINIDYDNYINLDMQKENAFNIQQSDVSNSKNHTNADIQKENTINTQHYNIYNGFNSGCESSLNVHMEKGNIPLNEYYNVQNHQNISQIERENYPNIQNYSVQSYENVHVKEDIFNDQPYVHSGFNNSFENDLNIHVKNENTLNVQCSDVYNRFYKNYDNCNEMESICDVQHCNIGCETKNDFENSSLFNFTPTMTENLDRFANLNGASHFCPECGIKFDDYQLMERHRLYECPSAQQIQMNETTPCINVYCSNCNTSFKYFSGSLSHSCLRCYNGLQFACGVCNSIHMSLNDAKKHVEQGICFQYSALPYSQIQNQNQFYAGYVNANINYSQAYHPHYVAHN